MDIKLPYGRDYLTANIPEDRLGGIISNKLDQFVPQKSQDELVIDAIEHPISSSRLLDLAKGKDNIVIIASDHTRPVPSKVIIPHMIDEIYSGNPNANIKILIATGCHRGTTKEELVNKLGKDITDNYEIIVHDCTDTDNLVDLGKLPSGGDLILNRYAYEADLLVSEGFIEPHFFAGFSGGRKSILPGIVSKKTVYANHCSKFIDSEYARAGILENNPIHKDMIYAARAASLAFIVNVVINSKHDVIGAFAGDVNDAHIEGTKFLESLCSSKPCYSDIVISTNNGYPLDQNVYQAVKGMSTAEMTCNENGVIIMAAKCEDGVGGDEFLKTFKNNPSASSILEEIKKVKQEDTIADQWQSQVFARILDKFKVIFISDVDDDTVKDLHMIPASSIDEAIGIADGILGNSNGKITVIPEGISSIIS